VFLLWWLLLSSAFAAEQGLLWHISGRGADGTLFGTMHSEDPRVTTLPEAVERHFNAAEMLMLEVSLDAQTQMAVALAMMLPESSSLSAVVGEGLGKQAQQAMLGFGIPPEVTERMQPWATVITLSMPKMETGQVLDLLLYQRAVQAGKSFQPLESPQEQLAVFTDLSNSEQKTLLRSVLMEYKSYPAMFERLTEAYLRRDLAAIVRMGEENPMSSDPTLQQKLTRRLLEERNRRMVERMEPQLQQGKVFIGVGALHLPGEQGLIALLRQRGYTVQAVY
jgi:uncharacterized protein YbaP (TraB family)